MGFDDEDFEKAKQVNSDTQLYKQAGNSIVVDVLEAIFGDMLWKYLQPIPGKNRTDGMGGVLPTDVWQI